MVLSLVQTVGKYTLGERIERPGPGESFLAHHRQRHVVVRLLADLPPERIAAFEAAVAHLANLDHPGIAPILAYGHEEGVPYLVTPLVAGERLATSFARRSPRPGDLARLVRQLAGVLDYAHGCDVAHGGFSSASVLVASDGELVIDDFGIAALYADVGARPGADIVALARLADEGAAGLPSTEVNPGAATEAVQAVLRQGLASNADGGYRSAEDFAAAFARALADTDVRIADPRPERQARAMPRLAQPFASRARRITALWGVAIALMAVLLIAGYIAMISAANSRAEAPPAVAPVRPELPPTGNLPFYFPVDNGLIAAKYAEAQRLLPPEAADARLHHFAAECPNPFVEETCLLVYVFYGRQADAMFNYHYSVNEDRLIGDFVEPAENDDFRVVLDELPWERNPNWERLINESYTQLPANLRFSVRLSSRAASFNDGSADWTTVYVDRADQKTQHIFVLLGDKVSKLPE